MSRLTWKYLAQCLILNRNLMIIVLYGQRQLGDFLLTTFLPILSVGHSCGLHLLEQSPFLKLGLMSQCCLLWAWGVLVYGSLRKVWKDSLPAPVPGWGMVCVCQGGSWGSVSAWVLLWRKASAHPELFSRRLWATLIPGPCHLLLHWDSWSQRLETTMFL